MASVLAVTAASAAGFIAGSSSPASAACSGTHCLPTSGYTFDSVWGSGCGAFPPSGPYCWDHNKRSYSTAAKHTYGFASASYGGGGSSNIGVALQQTNSALVVQDFSTSGLARVCYNTSCADQDSYLLLAVVFNNQYTHTLSGHAKA